jgi:hypothetical protein
MLLAHAAVMRAIGAKPVARVAQNQAERILAKTPQMNVEHTVPVDALLPEKRVD